MPHYQTPNTAIPTKTHAESPKTHQAVTSQVTCPRTVPERVPEHVAGAACEQTLHPLISQTAVPPAPMSVLGAIDDLCEHVYRDLPDAVVRRWLVLTAAAPGHAPRSMPSAA